MSGSQNYVFTLTKGIFIIASHRFLDQSISWTWSSCLVGLAGLLQGKCYIILSTTFYALCFEIALQSRVFFKVLK